MRGHVRFIKMHGGNLRVTTHLCVVSYHISSIFCLHHITLIFSRLMISNPAPYISGAHIWVKYSKKTSNSHHFDTIFNKNDLKTKGSFLFINTSIPFVFYPNLLIYTKKDSFANLFFVNKYSSFCLHCLL